VPVDIHRHEGGQLQKARIDAAQRPRISLRHDADQIALEPGHGAAHGKLVDTGRIDAGIHRPGHQRHAERLRGIAVLGHQCDRSERRDAGLAHRQDVTALADLLEESDQVIDELVEAERPCRGAMSRALCQSVT